MGEAKDAWTPLWMLVQTLPSIQRPLPSHVKELWISMAVATLDFLYPSNNDTTTDAATGGQDGL